ncbi:MAG: MBL fold metallo-hydrolase [Actinomycetota bacterium]|nr:MBL fold metallo-hydrolase [Actinomycetota bacterium]
MNFKEIADKLKEDNFKVFFKKYSGGSKSINIIGIKDMDSQNNLDSYQNTTYFISSREETIVIDPGIRGNRGHQIKDMILSGSKNFKTVITHFHLDHFIGYKPYIENSLFASERCIDVLSGSVKTIKVFDDGRLTYGHTRETPQRAIEDAKNELPIKREILKNYKEFITDIPIKWVELPGQTQGTLYGILNFGNEKILFGSDLFIDSKYGNSNCLKVEPHYDDEIDSKVIDNILIVLKAIMNMNYEISPEHKRDFPEIEKKLKELAFPTILMLGHGIFDMSASNIFKIVELIYGLDIRNAADKKFVI